MSLLPIGQTFSQMELAWANSGYKHLVSGSDLKCDFEAQLTIQLDIYAITRGVCAQICILRFVGGKRSKLNFDVLLSNECYFQVRSSQGCPMKLK